MKELQFKAEDHTTDWKESIAVKIAAVVVYAAVLVGVLVAAAVLWNTDKRFERELSAKADRLAYHLSAALLVEKNASADAMAKAAQQQINNFGFSAAVVSQNGHTARVGDPEGSPLTIERSLLTVPNAVITLYHPSLASLVKSRRNTVMLAAGVSAGVFGMFLTIVVLKSITAPIQALVKATKAATDGDLTVRADSTREDEFGVLAGYFNTMLSQIQNRDRELEQHRKHLEEQVSLRTTELRESNEELKRFMYTAAHDLRQPLVNIEGFSSELQKSVKMSMDIILASGDRCPAAERARLNRLFDKDILEATEFLRKSVEQMGVLINALMKISRVGYLVLRPERISMTELAQSLLAGHARMIKETQAMVDVGDLPEIMGDRSVVEQIMTSLLDNALKYLVPGRSGELEITAEQTKKETIIRVKDNGRGIDQDDITKIFEMFRRAGPQDIPGEGMGLSHVKALVRRHGGRIWCDSELGKGSTFSFTIPRSALVNE